MGRLGSVFIAYRPLGGPIDVSQYDQEMLLGGPRVGLATFFRIDGRSGGITVLATEDEFPGGTLDDFAAEMDARYWSFTAAGPNDGPAAEFDYRGADGALCRMRLEYKGLAGLPGSERRYVDCSTTPGAQYQELGEAEFFSALYGGQLMTSPHVSYEIGSDVLTVDGGSQPDLTYDWGALRVAGESIDVPIGCEDRAYLELGEPPEIELTATTSTGGAPFDVELGNAGFAATTVSIAFEGGDCTAGGAPPDASWLVPPDDVSILPGETVTISVPGPVAGCDPGDVAGELVFSSLEDNALTTRLPARLTVTP